MADYKNRKNTVGEEASGFGERVKGDVKEGFGKVTGNERLEAEGRGEANEGKARQAHNNVSARRRAQRRPATRVS